MQTVTCDVAVIGAGTAGLAARGAAARAGAKVVLIERGPEGTTCARVGCMPSKLLIAAAEKAHAVRNAAEFGVAAGACRIDGHAVMARLRRERDRFVRSVVENMERIPADQLAHGEARFLSPGVLQVGEGRIEARSIVVATGARPVVPPPFRGLGDRLLTNESVFELPALPQSVAVIGAGPLGLELAQALHRLGVRVSLFDQGTALAGLSDPRVSEAARAALGRELDLQLGADAQARRTDGGVEVVVGGRTAGTFDYLLCAAGRAPAFEALDLEKAGLELDEHGTPLFDRQSLQCGRSPVFLAGDCNHDRPLLHEAAWEGARAGSNAACWPNPPERGGRYVPLSIVFSQPQIAQVGATGTGEGIAAGSVEFGDQGRARMMGDNAGCLRIYAERGSGRVLGAQIAAPAAEHLAHLLAWAVEAGAKAQDLLSLPFYHPTYEEGLRSALRDLCRQVSLIPAAQSGDFDFGPGA